MSTRQHQEVMDSLSLRLGANSAALPGLKTSMRKKPPASHEMVPQDSVKPQGGVTCSCPPGTPQRP